MVNYIIIVILTALAVSFVITLGTKWGVWEYIAMNTKYELVNKLVSCHFCLSWWGSVIVTALWVVVSMLYGREIDVCYLFVPFFSTKISQILL